MAMNSGPIQTFTAGLLSLLQIKNRGLNPDILVGSVQPNLPMEGFWLRGSMEPVVSNVFAPVLPGNATLITLLSVPNNEWWFVHHIGLEAQETAPMASFGFQWSVGAAYPYPTGGFNPSIYTPYREGLVPAAFMGGGIYYAGGGGFWVPPGGFVQAQVVPAVSNTAGITFGGTVGWISRLRI